MGCKPIQVEKPQDNLCPGHVHVYQEGIAEPAHHLLPMASVNGAVGNVRKEHDITVLLRDGGKPVAREFSLRTLLSSVLLAKNSRMASLAAARVTFLGGALASSSAAALAPARVTGFLARPLVDLRAALATALAAALTGAADLDWDLDMLVSLVAYLTFNTHTTPSC